MTTTDILDSFSEVSREYILSKDKAKAMSNLMNSSFFKEKIHLSHIPKDPKDTFIKTPRKMAFVIPYWIYGGGSTNSAKWAQSVRNHGGEWGSELITGSASGRPPKAMRSDFPHTLLKWKDKDFVINYFRNFEFVVIWDCDPFDIGLTGLTEFPSWTEAFLGIDVPIVLFVCRTHVLDIKKSVFYEMLRLNKHVRAVGACRERLQELAEPFGLPTFSFNHHPVEVPEFQPTKFSERPVILYMGRIVFSKRIPEMVKASELVKSHLRFEMWGTFYGRSGYKMNLKCPSLDKIYVGPYSFSMLDDIYSRASFVVDLSNAQGDGGMQNIAMEAMERGVIPIVTKGWDTAPGMLSAGEKIGRVTVEDAVDGFTKASHITEEEAVFLQFQSWDWLCKNRDPKVLVKEMINFVCEKVL